MNHNGRRMRWSEAVHANILALLGAGNQTLRELATIESRLDELIRVLRDHFDRSARQILSIARKKGSHRNPGRRKTKPSKSKAGAARRRSS